MIVLTDLLTKHVFMSARLHDPIVLSEETRNLSNLLKMSDRCIDKLDKCDQSMVKLLQSQIK